MKPPRACVACGVMTECDYQIRRADPRRSEWVPLCARCLAGVGRRELGISRTPDGSLSITDARASARGRQR